SRSVPRGHKILSHRREVRLGDALLFLWGCAVVHTRGRLLLVLFILCAGRAPRCPLGPGREDRARAAASLLSETPAACHLLPAPSLPPTAPPASPGAPSASEWKNERGSLPASSA